MTTPTARRVAKAASWSVLEKIGLRFFPFLGFLVLAALLSPEAFGLVAAASVVVFSVQSLVESSLSTYLIQTTRLTRSVESTVFWLNLIASLILCVGVVLVGPILSERWALPDLAPIVAAMSLKLILVAVSSVPQALLMRELNFKALAIRSLIATSIATTVAIVCALSGFGAWALVVQAVGTSLLQLVLLLTLRPWHPSLVFSYSEAKACMAFGLPLVGQSLVGVAHQRIDEVVVVSSLGVEQLGIYVVAKRVVALVNEVTTSVLSQVSLPVLATVKEDSAHFARLFIQGQKMLSCVAIPLTVLAAFNLPWVLRVVLGSEWDNVSPILMVLILGVSVTAPFGLDRGALLARGRTLIELIVGILTVSVIAVAAILSAPFGLVALASAMAARTLVCLPFRWLGSAVGLGVSPKKYAPRQVAYLALMTLIITCVGLTARWLGADVWTWSTNPIAAGGASTVAVVLYSLFIWRINDPTFNYIARSLKKVLLRG